MDFINKLKQRYSVREYDTENNITDEQYKQIIDAINSAPTSSNWHASSVIVVRDKKILAQLGEVNKYTGAIKSCDIFLVFLADYNRVNIAKNTYTEYQYNNHSSETYTVAVGDAFIQATTAQDAAICLGFGTCFLGLTRTMVKELNEILNIKGQAVPIIGLTIGNIKNKGIVKPKMNRVFENKYDFDRLNSDINEYDKSLIAHFQKINPDKKAWSYKEATIKSASSYRMDTKLIEDIWELELSK